MTVFIVTSCALYTTKILAIFDSRAKAERFVRDEEKQPSLLSYKIEERTVQ